MIDHHAYLVLAHDRSAEPLLVHLQVVLVPVALAAVVALLGETVLAVGLEHVLD